MNTVAGWSEAVAEVADGFILPQEHYVRGSELGLAPPEDTRAAYDGGVYTGEGRIVPEAIHIGGSHRHVPAAWQEPPSDLGRLAGRWLYGGQLRGHFGHFLLESLGRLWHQPEGQPYDGIVFTPLSTKNRSSLAPAAHDRLIAGFSALPQRSFIRDTLALLVGDAPIHVATRPVQVQHLVVPTQLIGNVAESTFIAGHPTFLDFLRRKLPTRPGAGRRRIYISRSRLGARSSAFMLEALLEQELERHGYETVHPQELSIGAQLELYAECEKIIVSSGSAVHLLAYALNGSQDVALIDREFITMAKFAVQLHGMGARSVRRIERVASRIRPRDTAEDRLVGWKAHTALHALDLDGLWADLREAGFVTAEAHFADRVSAATPAAMEAASERYGGIELWREPYDEAVENRKRRLRALQDERLSHRRFEGHLDALKTREVVADAA